MATLYWRSFLLIFALIITTARSKTIGDRQVAETLDYLEKFGYYTKPPAAFSLGSDPTPPKLDDPSSKKAIRSFQKFYNLPQTGELDEVAAKLMSQPRCGVPDVADNGGALNFKVTCRRCTFKKRDVTYAIRVYSNKVSRSEVNREIGRAFKTWSKVTNLSFRKVNHNDADIRISFHGAQNGFDGNDDGGITGNTLAHAWPAQDGRLHFDQKRAWRTDPRYTNGVTLYKVAVHEIGHNLGLDHSTEKKSIMYPLIQDYINELQIDDIAGVQSIYGKPTSPPSATFEGQLFKIRRGISSAGNYISTGSAPGSTSSYPKRQIIMELSSNGITIKNARTNAAIYNHPLQSITHVIPRKTGNSFAYVYGNPTSGYTYYYFDNLDSESQKVMDTFRKQLDSVAFVPVTSNYQFFKDKYDIFKLQ